MTKPATGMDAIEFAARELADERRCLEGDVRMASAALDQVRAEWLVKLRDRATKVGELEDALLREVDRCPDLFKRPQSVEFDGVRVGWRKGKGRLELGDMDKLVARIRKQLTKAQQIAVLKVKVTVLKGPLGKLPAELLKKLGIDTTGAGSEPFFSYPKSDLQKLVDWWLKPVAASADEEE